MKGSLKLAISKNLMYVVARITADGEEEITESYLYSKLNEFDIKAGIRSDVISSMVTNTDYDKDYVIAEGKQPVQGSDGYYTFSFEPNKKEYQPIILDDGSVDYSIQRELVKAGDLIATYHPAEPGTYGYTVYASVVAPVPTKELPPLLLRGVKRESFSYFAETDGEVVYEDGRLTVDNVLLIKENATITTGSIKYVGDVHICGDVLSGTTIEVDGNLTVDGAVESATIRVSKDIVIRKGIFGRQKAVIQAKGSIHTTMIEEADVTAGESITLYYSYCSNLTAGKDIIADRRDGKLIGGIIEAGNSIYAKYTGNSAEIKTILQIAGNETGIPPSAKITVERQIFLGTELMFGNVVARNIESNGEYHLLDGEIHRYRIDGFTYEKKKKPVRVSKKPTILLVDDQPIVLKTFYSYLHTDYNVLAVNSAKDAFALMDTVLPDLILLDYKMPVIDGGEMLKQMRKTTWKRYQNVPVIFVTAIADKNTVEKVLSLYPQGYVIKPLKREELLDVVNNFFARRNQT